MAVDRELIGEFVDAAAQDQAKARRMLGEHPELLNARWRLGETALHFLAVESFTDAVRLLASLGADVNATNEFGATALIDVASLGNDLMAEVLLEFGADPERSFRDERQRSSLCSAFGEHAAGRSLAPSRGES